MAEPTEHPPTHLGQLRAAGVPQPLCSVGKCGQESVGPGPHRSGSDAGRTVTPQDGGQQQTPRRRTQGPHAGGREIRRASLPRMAMPSAWKAALAVRISSHGSPASWTLPEDPRESPGAPVFREGAQGLGAPAAPASLGKGSCVTATTDVWGRRRQCSREKGICTQATDTSHTRRPQWWIRKSSCGPGPRAGVRWQGGQEGVGRAGCGDWVRGGNPGGPGLGEGEGRKEGAGLAWGPGRWGTGTTEDQDPGGVGQEGAGRADCR